MSSRIHLGTSRPLGASVSTSGCNFAVHAPDAKSVSLCLFDKDEQLVAEYPMLGKSGPVWHLFVDGVQVGDLYGFRSNVRNAENKESQRLLIDPYAKAISRPCIWDREQYEHDNSAMVPKCIVTAPAEKKHSHMLYGKDDSRILYEAHVKGISKLHPDVPVDMRGTYLGASHPAILNHLKQLGVTTVQFLPLASFMAEPYITELGLTNYWGYNPINFFAAEPRYANSDAVTECRQMIEEYHAAGIEVIVDVVFNHTAEGGDGGQTLNFKALCEHDAYLFEQSPEGERRYINNSGCGNSINSAHPFMLSLILDALRYWVETMGVDGFRFDLAASLGRDPLAFSRDAAMFKAIHQDPVLRDVLLIAEPWDIGLGGYQVGSFPAGWRECNDKFRDTVRAFWRGDKGITSDFATRVMGSRDTFHKGIKPITTSVNPLTYHDGFTLHDLVSYQDKHNEANLEKNRDGHSHNLSANYGVEGETDDKRILSKRERQKRNMFTTLLISQGTPHILGGDELSRSQLGNNNAYCQDNPINWFNWRLDNRQRAFLNFCREVIALRNSSQLLSQLQLEDDDYFASSNIACANWYKPDGSYKKPGDWHEADNQAFAVELRGLSSKDANSNPEHWLICFNASDDDVRFSLPSLEPIGGWTLRLDTRYSSFTKQPKVCVKHLYLQSEKSIAIFTYSY